jgi:dihydrofolate reductase
LTLRLDGPGERTVRSVVAVMFVSLDGVGEFPLYDAVPGVIDDEPDPMWTPRMESIDTLILGRRSYEKWYEHWPKQKDNPEANEFSKSFSAFCDRTEKLVLSRTLKRVDWSNSRIVSGDIGEEVARLKARPGKDIAIGGGPRTLQAFLDRRLVDDLVLALFPSLVGEGKPLFHVVSKPDNERDMVPMGAIGRRDFTLVESTPLRDGTLFLHYRRAPTEPPAS